MLRKFLKRKGIPSSQRALKKIVPGKVFRVVCEQCADRRELFARMAQARSVREADVVRLVAEKMNLAFLPQLRPIDLELIRGLTTVSELHSMGAIPLCTQGMLAGMACIEPMLLTPLLKRFESMGLGNPPFALACWEDIARALAESEKPYLGIQQAEEQRGKGEQALALITEEAKKHGACEVAITLSEADCSYTFQARDGRNGRGTINPKLRDEVLRAIQQQHYTRRGDGFTISLSDQASEKVVRLEIIQKKPKAAPIQDPPKSDGPLVLVVDDNATFCQVLERFLVRSGMRPQVCGRADEVVTLLEGGTVKPALIICDVHMPGMNGFQFLARVRAQEALRHTPIIMLTSDGEVETELRVLEAGADAFITKTEDPRILCAHSRNLIERRKAA